VPGDPLVIWFDRIFPAPALERLRAGVAPHRLLEAPGQGGQARLGEADVAFGQPDAARCADLPRLAWVHLSSAGYTSFDSAAVRAALARRGAALTTSSSVYSEPCAQHLLAFLLAEARQIGRAMRHQLGDRAWAQDEVRAASRLLAGGTVLLVGMGAIARRLVELLAPFDLEVVGVRRALRGDEPVPTVPVAALDAWLPRADHVVSTLPGAADTLRLFDAARFALLRPGAVFYNIGRGSTVDGDALLAALTSGRLRAAYLDVTDPEPLPPEHPLWRVPTCTITPHAAGGHADEHERLVDHFLYNWRRREAGEPLRDRIV